MNGLALALGFAVTPDSAKLAFVATNNGADDVEIDPFNVGTNRVEAVTPDGHVTNQAWKKRATKVVLKPGETRTWEYDTAFLRIWTRRGSGAYHLCWRVEHKGGQSLSNAVVVFADNEGENGREAQ